MTEITTQVKSTINATSLDRLKNIENGTYIKGKFCTVHVKENTNKKDGTTWNTFSLVIETDMISNKTWVRFTKEQINDGLHEKFTDSYIGKTIMIPVFQTPPNIYNGKAYSNLFYQGDHLPVFFD